jgi:hypothetical protein
MKQKKKTECDNMGIVNRPPQTAFELMMNVQCGLRAEVGLEPLPHWKQTTETPQWTKNIYVKLRNTILKSVLKLKPDGIVNWRNYGRCIGIVERYKTFLSHDVPRILADEDLDKLSSHELEKLQPLLGEEQARQYCLKLLELPANDKTPLPALADKVLEIQLENLEKLKKIAFCHVANQDAKTGAIFMKGMGEGYIIFLNEEGEFTGDDRRADIHLELIAWQYDIEKMRKSALPRMRKKLFGELRELPEYHKKKQDWFDDVCKDIKLSLGKPGRPRK